MNALSVILLLFSAAILVALFVYVRRASRLLAQNEKSLALAQDSLNEAAVARREMREAVARAEQEVKLRTNFLATMSHEIRTPLNAVVGFSEFLSVPGVSPEKVGEYARGISLSANALLSLINDILDLSKFDSGKSAGFDMRSGECDLAMLFSEMNSIFRMRAERKGVTFATESAESLPPLTLSEPRVRQILLNLIGNAVKFTDHGGVTVSVVYENEVFRLKVADTGIGISPRGVERIFDPFVQDMETRGGKVYEGTGLGLPIIKRIVEASQGRIVVDSIVGKGSTFTVEIPGVRVVERKAKTAAELAPNRQRVEKVIIVDDVALNRKVLKMHCMALGISEPVVCESGDEVLRYLENPENVCDLVLSDVWMPGMDGAELSRRIAKLRPGLPVIAVTADTDIAATFGDSAFAGVLTKPVTAAKLAEIMRACG